MLFAVTADTVLVTDLSADLLVYEQSFETYVPYTEGESHRLSLFRDFSSEEGYFLTFPANTGLAVFSDNKLIYENLSGKQQLGMIPVSALTLKNQKKALITFYDPNAPVSSKVRLTFVGNTSQYPLSKGLIHREDSPKEPLFFLFVLLLCTLVFMKNRYPKKTTSFLRFFSSSEINPALFDVFSSFNVWIIVFNSLSFTFLCAIFLLHSMTFLGLMIVAFALLLAFFTKYFFLMFIGEVFRLGNIAKVHFIQFLGFSFLGSVILVPLFAIFYFSEWIDYTISYMLLFWLGTILMILLSIKLNLLIFRHTYFRYFYLFSYLCLSELIPIGFALKIALAG